MSIVLCIDSDARQGAATSRLLRQLGCSVVAPPDTAEALDMFAAHHPDIALVLVDAAVPHRRDRDLLRQLTRIDARVPVIVLCGDDDDAAVVVSPGATVTAVLRKPPQADELLAVLPASLRAAREMAPLFSLPLDPQPMPAP